jgi:hypothetical protein
MKKIISLFSILIFVAINPSNAFAQKAKIIKVKGQQAIVQFPTGARPEVGQILTLDEGDEKFSPQVDATARQQIIGGSANLSFLNNSLNSRSTTDFGFSGRYGWNMVQIEYGPTVVFDYSTTDSNSSRTIEAGGFFDYNLVPNKTGTVLVYGAGGELEYGQTSTTVSSSTSTNTLFHFFAGGQLKWFPIKDSIAIRGDAGFDSSATTSTSTTVTISGLLLKGGLYIYF